MAEDLQAQHTMYERAVILRARQLARLTGAAFLAQLEAGKLTAERVAAVGVQVELLCDSVTALDRCAAEIGKRHRRR